jgi:hypothetical protein
MELLREKLDNDFIYIGITQEVKQIVQVNSKTVFIHYYLYAQLYSTF